MTDEKSSMKILVDTNVLVDLILGIVLAFCRKGVLEVIRGLMQKINDNNALLILTEKSVRELEHVLRKGENKNILQKCKCDPKEIVDIVVNSPGVEVVSISKDEEETLIQEYGKYVETHRLSLPREDAHILAALVKCSPTFFVSRDEKVYRTAGIISIKERLGVAIKGFKGFVDTLVLLGAMDKYTRYIVGYKAYKAQILPFTHHEAFRCGYSGNTQGLKSWVEYSQSKLQEYIPCVLQKR